MINDTFESEMILLNLKYWYVTWNNEIILYANWIKIFTIYLIDLLQAPKGIAAIMCQLRITEYGLNTSSL